MYIVAHPVSAKHSRVTTSISVPCEAGNTSMEKQDFEGILETKTARLILKVIRYSSKVVVTHASYQVKKRRFFRRVHLDAGGVSDGNFGDPSHEEMVESIGGDRCPARRGFGR